MLKPSMYAMRALDKPDARSAVAVTQRSVRRWPSWRRGCRQEAPGTRNGAEIRLRTKAASTMVVRTRLER